MAVFGRVCRAMSRCACSAILVAFAGCGRYKGPLPPEAVSPASVKDLKVQATLEGIDFSWGSPKTNRQGKELKDLSGYVVERKTIVNDADAVNNDVEFEKLVTIEDISIKTLEEERKRLRAEEKPSHRAKVDSALQEFKYTDATVVPGTKYLYRVVPQSYYGDGAVGQLARVLFRGDASEVTIYNGSDLGDDLTESLFQSDAAEE